MARVAREQAIVKALVEASQVELPDALVEKELATQLESMERSLGRQGLRLDRHFDYLGKTWPQRDADERPDAEARPKVDLVPDEFPKQEGNAPSADLLPNNIEQQ